MLCYKRRIKPLVHVGKRRRRLRGLPGGEGRKGRGMRREGRTRKPEALRTVKTASYFFRSRLRDILRVTLVSQSQRVRKRVTYRDAKNSLIL